MRCRLVEKKLLFLSYTALYLLLQTCPFAYLFLSLDPPPPPLSVVAAVVSMSSVPAFPGRCLSDASRASSWWGNAEEGSPVGGGGGGDQRRPAFTK